MVNHPSTQVRKNGAVADRDFMPLQTQLILIFRHQRECIL